MHEIDGIELNLKYVIGYSSLTKRRINTVLHKLVIILAIYQGYM